MGGAGQITWGGGPDAAEQLAVSASTASCASWTYLPAGTARTSTRNRDRRQAARGVAVGPTLRQAVPAQRGGLGGTYKFGGVVVRCILCDGLIIRVGKHRFLRIVDLPAGLPRRANRPWVAVGPTSNGSQWSKVWMARDRFMISSRYS